VRSLTSADPFHSQCRCWRSPPSLTEGSAGSSKWAGPPERVAAAVERALTTGRPRARYVVGGDAHVAFSIGKLPASVMDRVLSKTVGITQKRADG